HRVELLHLGIAHTHGDGFAWLPKEKILFTGDACVNGPYNYVGDGNVGQWIKTLDVAKELGAKIICPGHGPAGTAQMLQDQQDYFVALRQEVQKLMNAGKKSEEVRAAIEDLRTQIKARDRIGRYVGDMFPGQVEKVFVELGGKGWSAVSPADEHFQRAETREQQSRTGVLGRRRK
ncbi:MAG: MBL fold metallo-hydrolase, partial [Verrucomicrobiota bacterium]